MANNALETRHRLVRTQDASGLAALLAEDAVFHWPIVHNPQRGRKLASLYLAAAFRVFFNPTFRYVREITEFKVMLRPLKAINLIHQRMAAMRQSSQ